MGKRGSLPRRTQIQQRRDKMCLVGREAEREERGFPKLPSGKVVGRNLCFWSHHLVAV